MNLSISKSILAPALRRAAQTADEKATSNGITGLVRLKATGGKLTITATDLRVTAISVLPATVTAPGAVLVDADLIAGIVGKAPTDEIALAFDGRALIVKSGKSRPELHALPDREFPSVPDIDRATFAPCEPSTLADMLAKVLPAVCLDATRVAVNGVAFVIGSKSSGGARMVASDGHRMSLAVSDLALPEHKQIVMTVEGAKAIARLVADSDDCAVGFVDPYLMVRAGNTVLASKLADVEFAPWQQIIPRGHPNRYTFNRAEMVAALDRASLMVGTENVAGKKVIMGVDVAFGEDGIEIDVAHPEAGKAHEEVDASVIGKPVKLRLSHNFLRDALNAIAGEHAVIEAGGPLDAIVVRAHEGGESLSVVMPMRIG